MTKVTRLTLEEGGEMKSRRIHLREISDESDAPLETVGQDLRAARLRRGDDLATVSKSLKIRKDYLEAIEEDRLDALPGKAYAVGFVRSYAYYLGLDVTQCVDRFKAEIAGRSDGDNQPRVTVIDEEERRMPRGWPVVAAVVLALIAYGIYYVFTSSTSEPIVAAPPAPQVAAIKPVVTPHKPAPVQTAATPAPATTPVAGAQAPAAPGVTAPKSTSAAADVLPAGQVYGKGNFGSRITLRVHQPTRLLVQGPGGMVYINRALARGDTYNVPNVIGATLSATTANAVEIVLDGQSVGYAGNGSGVTDGQSLNPQTIADHSKAGGPG
jgi:cytoskeleton protein RodZ